MRNFYSITKAQTGAEPLALSDAKTYLRIDGTDDDTLVTALIASSRSVAEKYINKAIVQYTVTLTLDYLPPGGILLPIGPVQSVTSIQVTDSSNTTTTWNSSNYVVDTQGGRIVYVVGASLPPSYALVNGVTVTYVAGYGLASDVTGVPAGIVQGIRHLIAGSYENREVAVDVPPLVCALLDPFKKYVI